MWELVKKKNLEGDNTRSHLPRDNDASLLAVSHCISVWAGRATGQQSSQLLGTYSSSTAAMPIRLVSWANLGWVRRQSLPCLLNAHWQRNQHQRVSATFHGAVEAEHLQGITIIHPVNHYTQLIIFLCPGSSCTTITLCGIIKMLIFSFSHMRIQIIEAL